VIQDIAPKPKQWSELWLSDPLACGTLLFLRERRIVKNHDTLIDPLTTGQLTVLDTRVPTLTVLAGSDVGRIFALELGASILGRSPQSEVHIAHESISRRHCEVTVRPQGRVFVRDLGSTNGTRVDEAEISAAPLELTGDERIRLSKKVVLKFAFQDHLEREVQEDLYSSAVRDPLTGIHNKRFLQERLEHEVAFAARHDVELSLMMFDLDHFKQVNDTYGHPVGDTVLVEIARRVHNTLRSEDVFARFGGEEFVVLMRGTPIKEAKRAAERILQAIREKPIQAEQHNIQVTVSIGVASYNPDQNMSASSLLASADLLLYEAKGQGRDRLVCISDDE
jgi:two-component system cell cycle response regulator